MRAREVYIHTIDLGARTQSQNLPAASSPRCSTT